MVSATAMRQQLAALRPVVAGCGDEDFDRFMARGGRAMLRSKGFESDRLEEAVAVGTIVTECRRFGDAPSGAEARAGYRNWSRPRSRSGAGSCLVGSRSSGCGKSEGGNDGDTAERCLSGRAGPASVHLELRRNLFSSWHIGRRYSLWTCNRSNRETSKPFSCIHAWSYFGFSKWRFYINVTGDCASWNKSNFFNYILGF